MELNFPIVQVLNEDGTVVQPEYRERITKPLTMTMYRHLIRTRTFDRKCVSLQRQGRIGTYVPYEGQEACQVGSALALNDGDWMFPTYRDHGAMMTFGRPLTTTLLYWKGRTEGCVPPEGKKIVPPSVPIATQLPQAAGAACAEKWKGTNNAVLVYFGDGATSEGDFHEGLNFASVFDAPVVFFNQNNQYAISVPITRQMKTKTIAQKALAYDIPGIRIDGNDVFAVYFHTAEALERARNGGGPTLIEAVTWRYGAHTTSDDPSRYRDQEESKKRRETTDPIKRVERLMQREGWWDEEWAKQVQAEVDAEIEQAVTEMERYPKADATDMFDFVFAQPTWTIAEQKEAYLQWKRGMAT
ncbi:MULTISPECIES: pyruvate dehydrogenase (acetyl-transferring) E1 component subunit alpha [Geobacillus]|uniref:Pyruvate dehydrogenase E1 component subunit alpha n=1 Tax=Geobacillus thermocatenulatus TaxID=33938 RepID=A0A226QBR4_9BACL|nr:MULTISPECIES: pyruvate dehydrogenase (acetyl-transferring) E1 component subunit alpha [Geobacillus]ASS99244.1 pyruvate dehydrogenase (acetyl-transferring) E1 component subunit alpha [Geobacillus thermocatenulatus]KLR73298.1 pyruvate dehydrogenase [Geobacillus sp. T6]OXB90073.1 pyruvate dehydrogenase (acetyl-transferring) E1 component subunit alpha [Geobacillus thermocatenulatus]